MFRFLGLLFLELYNSHIALPKLSIHSLPIKNPNHFLISTLELYDFPSSSHIALIKLYFNFVWPILDSKVYLGFLFSEFYNSHIALPKLKLLIKIPNDIQDSHFGVIQFALILQHCSYQT